MRLHSFWSAPRIPTSVPPQFFLKSDWLVLIITAMSFHVAYIFPALQIYMYVILYVHLLMCLHHLWVYHGFTKLSVGFNDSSVGRVLHWYDKNRRGNGFESHLSLIFSSRLYFHNCLSCIHNYDDLSCSYILARNDNSY